MLKEKVYIIKDSEGRYNGGLNICANSWNGRGNYKWDYFSQTYPNRGNAIKENTELDLKRLQELNELAEYELTWEVVELIWEEIFELKEIQRLKNPSSSNMKTQQKEIKKGHIGKHRKLVREIYKKYKPLNKRIS